MAHRSLATRIWGPAAYVLRRHPVPGVPPPPPAVAERSRFVGTIRNQAKPQSNLKIIQQEGVSMLEKVYLLGELENITVVAKQRMVELEEVRRQKKKTQKIYGFTLAAVACMTAYVAKMSP